MAGSQKEPGDCASVQGPGREAQGCSSCRPLPRAEGGGQKARGAQSAPGRGRPGCESCRCASVAGSETRFDVHLGQPHLLGQHPASWGALVAACWKELCRVLRDRLSMVLWGERSSPGCWGKRELSMVLGGKQLSMVLWGGALQGAGLLHCAGRVHAEAGAMGPLTQASCGCPWCRHTWGLQLPHACSLRGLSTAGHPGRGRKAPQMSVGLGCATVPRGCSGRARPQSQSWRVALATRKGGGGTHDQTLGAVQDPPGDRGGARRLATVRQAEHCPPLT